MEKPKFKPENYEAIAALSQDIQRHFAAKVQDAVKATEGFQDTINIQHQLISNTLLDNLESFSVLIQSLETENSELYEQNPEFFHNLMAVYSALCLSVKNTNATIMPKLFEQIQTRIHTQITDDVQDTLDIYSCACIVSIKEANNLLTEKLKQANVEAVNHTQLLADSVQTLQKKVKAAKHWVVRWQLLAMASIFFCIFQIAITWFLVH